MIETRSATRSGLSDYRACLSTDLMHFSRTKEIHMDIHCANGWLFHEWKDGKCKRCRVTYRGTLTDVTLADDPCLFEGHVQVHPAGLASQRDYHHPVGHPLRLVPRILDEDGSTFASSAADPACSEGSAGHLLSVVARLFRSS